MVIVLGEGRVDAAAHAKRLHGDKAQISLWSLHHMSLACRVGYFAPTSDILTVIRRLTGGVEGMGSVHSRRGSEKLCGGF